MYAPIKSVEVQSSNGGTTKIIEENKIVLSGYTQNSLTSGQNYQELVSALTEVLTTTTVILKAGDEYDAFVADAAAF